MSNFSIDKKVQGDELVVTLAGSIDEDASFNGQTFETGKKIVLDLEKVRAINSCGIREWIKWIRTAPNDSKIVYKNCPKVIVDQINMVAGFLPDNGDVESFYVPYYSETSGTEKSVLFTKGKEYGAGALKFPQVKDDTGQEMEMDVIETKYFKFLQK